MYLQQCSLPLSTEAAATRRRMHLKNSEKRVSRCIMPTSYHLNLQSLDGMEMTVTQKSYATNGKRQVELIEYNLY